MQGNNLEHQRQHYRRALVAPALCIPLALEHCGSGPSHLSPGHQAQWGHPKGSSQQEAAVVCNRSWGLWCFARSSTYLFLLSRLEQISFKYQKLNPSHCWLCELCLKKSAKVGFVSLKMRTFIAFPLAKQTWNNKNRQLRRIIKVIQNRSFLAILLCY